MNSSTNRQSLGQQRPKYAQLIRESIIITLICILCVVNIINCQTEEGFHTDCNQRHRYQQQQQQQHQHQRQQRKYVPLQQPAAAKLQKVAGGDTTGEHEEFSLLTSSLASNQQQQQQPQQLSQQLANTNYSLLPASSNGTATTQLTTDAGEAQASATTPTMAGLDSIGSSVVLQPPVTTTSSIQLSTSTKSSLDATHSTSTVPLDPAEANNATSGPTAATISPTTDSQPNALITSRKESTSGSGGHNTRQQASRRMEDSESTQRSMSLDQESHHHYQQQSQQQSVSQPISSSPSSVSIITPLIGPPQQQQQPQHHTTQVSASIGSSLQSSESQQSMMRPIYVLGNPITERDYYSTSNSQGRYSQSSGAAANSHSESPSISSSETPPLAAIDVAAVTADQSRDQVKPSESQSISQPSIQNINRQQPKLPETPQPAQQQHSASSKSTRLENSRDDSSAPQMDVTLQSQQDPPSGERMSGPPLVYSGGFLGSALNQSAVTNQTVQQQPTTGQQQQPAAAPRLFQAGQPNSSISNNLVGASVLPNSPRRPSLPPPVNQVNAASGFRSPLSPSGPLLGAGNTQANQQQQQQQLIMPPISSIPVNSMSNFYQSAPPYAGNSGNSGNSGIMTATGPSLAGNSFAQAPPQLAYNKQIFAMANQAAREQQQVTQQQQAVQQQQQQQLVPSPMPGTAPGSGRRPLNITRVEHISAECSNDLIRAVIVFNGTFKGIIYSSGYVNDPTCLYVNGTGSTRYEFNIRLNQCGTLGRQELHQPTIPGEAREWDEHFRVSCEYGSDFWKTVSFNPFNVETNTGSPVVFTINPPQCQMDVLLGHGMGPKIAVDGPVTVGDPLTLLIHMKSEKAGYDILVKNCVAHNGGKQRMQLIDSNGCVVNERFISPFRGTYNDNDLRHVTLYAYLKAFRFTGSPVLYLECEIHMCQSACPPQMCYWRRLSKRSVDDSDYEYVASNSSIMTSSRDDDSDQRQQPIISDSLSLFKALQVRQEPDEERRSGHVGRQSSRQKRVRDIFAEDEQAALVCYRYAEVYLFLITIGALLLLLASVAFTCCMRLRKLAKSHLFKQGRLLASSSLISIGGSGGETSSIISASASSRQLHSPTEQNLPSPGQYDFSSNKRPTAGWLMANGDIVRKQRVSPPNQPTKQHYLASFAQFTSPKLAHR